MSASGTRPIPLLGDISLEYVQQIENEIDGGFVATRIADLPGALQQRTGRPSHHITIRGLLTGPTAADQLATLQRASTSGEELTFAADITTALDLQRVVITSFSGVEAAGRPGMYFYTLVLAESPPLPPPAQVSAFGGLDDFGLGDLGFDTDILGDIQDLAGEIAGAVTDALDVIDQLGALASLGDLQLGGFLSPMGDIADSVRGIGSRFGDAARTVAGVFDT